MHDGAQRNGRDIARRGEFITREDWQTVRVPFSSLKATVHGEPVDAEPLALDAVESIALYIADGKDGPFRLEVDWIRAVDRVRLRADRAEVAWHDGFEPPHEGRVHVGEVVGDAEADHALPVEVRPELLPEFAEVRLLHDEDDIGPRDERRGEPFLRVAGQSRRGDLDAGVGGEDRFGCRARSRFRLQTKRTCFT